MIRIPDELFEDQQRRAPAAPPSFTPELAAARQAAALTRAGAESTRALHELDRALDEGNVDPAAWADSFAQEAQRLRDDHLASLPEPAAEEAFIRDFDDLAAAKIAGVKRRAAAQEVADTRAQLDETLDGYATLAAEASSDVEAQIARDQAEAAIGRMEVAGFLRPGEADDLRQSYAARRDLACVNLFMRYDPHKAREELKDVTRFPAIAADIRVRLLDRAQIRAENQQRAAAAAASTERQGRLAGLMVRLEADDADRADIMQAVSDGWLRPAERDRALDLWNRRRAQIRQRASDLDRVAAALAGEATPLDPRNPRDREALDTHFADAKAAWLAAGVREDELAPLIADYVGTAGALPNDARRDIAGAFRTGDPQTRVRTANLIAQLPSEALEDIPQRDGAEALLILALQQTGWPPEQAADRAAAIMAGTIDPDDRFVDQDSAAITAMIPTEARPDIQLASLRPNEIVSEPDTSVASDAPTTGEGETKVALLPALPLLIYGGAALLAMLTVKAAADAGKAIGDFKSKDPFGMDQDLSDAQRSPPLRSQEQTPPQPNDLPNIPPPRPAGVEILEPPLFEIDLPTFPPSDPNKSTIQIYEPPDFPISQIIERKGNALTKAELDAVLGYVLRHNPHLKHIAGGRRLETGEEVSEYWHPGPGYAEDEHGVRGDGRPGGHWADLTLKAPNGKLIHIQLVDVDKNGNPTDREIKNARALGQPHFVNGELRTADVYLVRKRWQMKN